MAYNTGKKFENSQKMKFVFIKWIPRGYESRLKDYRRFSNVVRALVIVCCSLCVTFLVLPHFDVICNLITEQMHGNMYMKAVC